MESTEMRIKLILLGTTLLFGIGAVASLRAQNPTHSLPTPVYGEPPHLPNSLVEGYKSWVRVNAKPHQVTSRIALMCRMPTQQEVDAEAADPHLEAGDHPSILRGRFVTVYVNKRAEQAMLHQKHPVFPEGSLIVKERSARPNSSMPELLTVMHKREKGYNSDCGDWEFTTLDGAGKQITAQGRLQKCESCHAEWKQTDYTSRAYLSAAVTRDFR
jgi:hypothetical protein